MTRERESIDVFHNHTATSSTTKPDLPTPRLVVKPSQQTSLALPQPDFTKEKNPTPSQTPHSKKRR